MNNVIIKKCVCIILTLFILMFGFYDDYAYAEDFNNIEPPHPGSLDINKSVTPVKGMSNQWEITLEMTGKNLPITSDIVLVIDTSGSMEGNRLNSAKEAARNFINTLLTNNNSTTRIAVVSFAGDATIHNVVGQDKSTAFKGSSLSEKRALLDSVNGLRAVGGTFTQAGIKAARELLKDSNSLSKNIVLLSDGEPTYGYSMTDYTKYSLRYPDGDEIDDYSRWYFFWTEYFRDINTAFENPPNSATEDFNYGSMIGAGNELRDEIASLPDGPRTGNGTRNNRYTQKYNTLYYNAGNSAISEALFAKSDNQNIYTVALSAGSIGTLVLNQISDEGKSYTASIGDLNAIFQTIAGRISYAATNAVVIDPIGVKFSIPGINASNYRDKIYVNQGILSWSNTTETITWKLDTISEGNPAIMKYTVQIDGDIQSGQVYPTNGETYITYTNSRDQDAKKTFPMPKAGVDAGTIQIHYYRVNKAGQPINSQGIPITKEQAEIQSSTYEEGTNLQLNVPYTVNGPSEISLAGKTYKYNSTGNIGDTNPTVVSLTPAIPSKHIWLAYCEVKDITVTFNENYSGAPENYTRITRKGTSLGSNNMPANPLRLGYDFKGWYESLNFNGEEFTESSIVNDNITVFAKWYLSTNELVSNKMHSKGSTPNTNNNQHEYDIVKDVFYTFELQLDLKNTDSNIIIKPTGNVTIDSGSFKIYGEDNKQINNGVISTRDRDNVILQIKNSIILDKKYTITYNIKGNDEQTTASVEILEKSNGEIKSINKSSGDIPNPIYLNIKKMPDLQ